MFVLKPEPNSIIPFFLLLFSWKDIDLQALEKIFSLPSPHFQWFGDRHSLQEAKRILEANCLSRQGFEFGSQESHPT